MPRSPVKRPPADLDLSRALRTVEQLPETLTSQSLFGNDHPLEIEIGSGKGLFLSREALEHPETNFVGVEIMAKYARHTAARLARAGVGNAIAISGNAEPLLEKRIPAGSLQAVHIYFPDPWWKKRHRRRRVVNETSIRNIARLLAPGGRFHFWTDVLEYFEQAVEMIAVTAPELGVPIPEEEIEASHDLDYRTHFERRSRKHQIPVYRVRYQTRSDASRSCRRVAT